MHWALDKMLPKYYYYSMLSLLFLVVGIYAITQSHNDKSMVFMAVSFITLFIAALGMILFLYLH